MRVALDIDDTITRCPEFFSFISKAMMAAGHDVYVISYRDNQQAVEEELRDIHNIAFRQVVLPSEDDFRDQGFYEWKANVCRSLKIDIFFEDMPEVVNELDRSVVAFMPFDAGLGRVTYVDDTGQEVGHGV